MGRKKNDETGKNTTFSSKEEVGKRLLGRLIDSGLDMLVSTSEDGEKTTIRPLALPKEVISYFVSQIDRSKSEIVTLFGREFKRFLEATDLSEEVVKAMSQLSVEVKAEFRFKRGNEELASTEINTTKIGSGKTKGTEKSK